MLARFRVLPLIAAFLPICLVTFAQQTAPAGDKSIHLNVVVAPDKSTEAVGGLREGDFTLLDNKKAQPMTSFKAMQRGQEPVEVILLLDAVNTRFSTVAYVRDSVQKFLKTDEGKVGLPMTIGVLTDKGVQMQQGFSTDGNVLSDSLTHYTIGLREIRGNEGFWGASERLQVSLAAIGQLTSYAGTLPGRKIVLWISPGWPLLSGPGVELDSKQQHQIFSEVVGFSTQLRKSNVTLYNINPLGVGESLMRADYYQSFEKGISKPNQTNIGDLGLQVLALQSGGLALESNSDVAGMLKRCMQDLDAWYEVSFDAAVAESPNEYHHLEMRVAEPGLKARTRDGYYAQVSSDGPANPAR